jgi:hypothetical protein
VATPCRPTRGVGAAEGGTRAAFALAVGGSTASPRAPAPRERRSMVGMPGVHERTLRVSQHRRRFGSRLCLRGLNNRWPEGFGGAIWNVGDMTITDSTFSNNVASSRGGAIENNGTGTFTVRRISSAAISPLAAVQSLTTAATLRSSTARSRGIPRTSRAAGSTLAAAARRPSGGHRSPVTRRTTSSTLHSTDCL